MNFFNQFTELLNTSEAKSSNYFDSTLVFKTFLNDKKKTIYHLILIFILEFFCYLKWRKPF